MHSIEMQRSHRRLMFDLITGTVIGTWSGGGTLLDNKGADLIQASWLPPDQSDPVLTIGCIEEYYRPLHGRDPMRVDPTKASACIQAVTTHQQAKESLATFVFETGLLLEQASISARDLEQRLKRKEVLTRDDESAHEAIVAIQARFTELRTACVEACEQILITRDDAIEYVPAFTSE